MVKVVPLDAVSPPRRLGFMDGEGRVPDDFDRLGAVEIEALFAGAGPKRRRG
jgi:hypothetical protein